MTSRIERIGVTTLYLGDSREILPALPRPWAIVSDPPYGQSLATSKRYAVKPVRGGKPAGRVGANVITSKERISILGDDAPFDPAWLLELSDNVLLWGAHKFWGRLPADTGRLLFWDKRPNGVVRYQGCGEMAWHNRPGVVRVFRHLWDGICVQAGSRSDIKGGRQHPTQKPVALMEWCLGQVGAETTSTVADPYMGSGSTGIACVRRGVPFVGVEMVAAHFDTACRRIEEAERACRRTRYSQPELAV